MVEMPRKKEFEQGAELPRDAQAAGGPLAPAAPGKSGQRSKFKQVIFAFALLAGTLAGGYYGHRYWTVGQYLETTDDAYVKADYTTIAPKVAGYLSEVLVEDNEHVTAGQVLARIDDRDFRTALAQAQADVKLAEATRKNLDAQITLQQSLVAQAEAAVDASRASLVFAQAEADRYRDLMKTGAGTLQRAQQTDSAHQEAQAKLQRDLSGLVAAKKKIQVLAAQREQADAQYQRSVALARQAELNLSYTTIVAPVSGQVGARSLRVGQYVTAGTQLMAVVPLHGAYIVANFKETQLTFVRNGQPVEIRVDTFPGLRLEGHVDSLSPASGQEFALLPPDNATGNFTKVVQRIPVKITLDDGVPADVLRAGMSVEPTIDTKATVMAMRGRPAAYARRNVPSGVRRVGALVESRAALVPVETQP